MTFIDSGDSSPVENYMSGTLHFRAPFYWHIMNHNLGYNVDVPTSWSPLKQIGSEYINAIAYSFAKPISIGFDEYDYFDNTVRNSPYSSDYYNEVYMNVSGGINTRYRNICSDRFFKEGVVVGKNIDLYIYIRSVNYISSRRIKIIASLIDSSGNKTSIGDSGWKSIAVGDSIYSLNIISAGVEVVGTNKKLFIEYIYELTHDASTSQSQMIVYNGQISSSILYSYAGPFISCSAE